ncbi:MAG: ABC transporter substrate-binding protein [Chloroflexi bacterium]|nr:ABC transporter substrate-binding protein [Chloroflexota bacterium]
MDKNKNGVSRRRFVILTGGALVASGILAACGDNTPTTAPAATTAAATTAAAQTTAAATSAAATTAAATTAGTTGAAQTTAAATTSAAAPTAALNNPNGKPGGIFKVGVTQDAVGFDPHVTNATASYRVLENVYGGLMRFNEKLEIQPDLATSYVQNDPTTYTFTLRKGVKFHSGKPFTSADVVYSLNRVKDPAVASPRAAQLAPIASMETPDDYTVVIKLKTAYSPFLSVLADNITTAIVNKATVEANGGKLDEKHADGTGPFKLTEYVPNTRIVVVKNPDYYIQGRPYLDGITFTPIPDDTARSTAVRTGAVDFVEYAPAKDLDLFKKDSNLVVTGDANNNVRFLAFNLTVKPFDNVKVRQAIAYAVDRQQVLDAAVNGAGTPLDAGPYLPSYWPGLQQPIYKQDLAKAKSLLAEAGFPNGFSAKLKNTPTYSFLGNAGIVVQEQLKAVGINFEIVSEEWSVFLKDYLGKNFEACVSGYSGFVDPDAPLTNNYVTGKANNFMSYSNPEYDKLVQQASEISDQAQRAKLYQQAQTILANDAPMVFLYAANQYEAMAKYVTGYLHYPNGSHLSFRDVSLNK